MEETLIEFDENESNNSKETIWSIENNEKMQLASFIEQQILTKMQYLFYEKDKQIRELRMTNAYLHTEIDDFKDKLSILENLIYEGFTDIKENLQIVTDDVATVTQDVATVTEDVATVTEDVAKHTNYLSNSYINLYPNSWRASPVHDLVFKTNVKEIDFQESINYNSVDNILWELIEYFTELEKLIIVSNIVGLLSAAATSLLQAEHNKKKLKVYGGVPNAYARIIKKSLPCHTQLNSRISIFTKIKSKTITELIISHLGCTVDSNRQSHPLYIPEYIEDVLTNIPNLQILEINYRPDLCRCPTWINNFVEKITSTVHKLQKIKLTKNGTGTTPDLTRIQTYCNINNIVLEMD